MQPRSREVAFPASNGAEGVVQRCVAVRPRRGGGQRKESSSQGLAGAGCSAPALHTMCSGAAGDAEDEQVPQWASSTIPSFYLICRPHVSQHVGQPTLFSVLSDGVDGKCGARDSEVLCPNLSFSRPRRGSWRLSLGAEACMDIFAGKQGHPAKAPPPTSRHVPVAAQAEAQALAERYAEQVRHASQLDGSCGIDCPGP